MPYHRFINLAKLLNQELAAKIGQEYSPNIEWIENITVLFHLKSTGNMSRKVNAGLGV